MLKISDKQMNLVAILENAYAISYKKSFNSVWTASFSLPIDDPKNAECQPFRFVEITDDITGEYIGLFRIVPTETVKDEIANEITYELEHVIATLTDDVLFRYHQTTNLTTAENILYILDQQSTKHWALGTCDFTYYFSYSWSNENGLLGALFSLTKPFTVPFEWTWDTKTYPWTLNLIRPETEPTCVIRYGRNMRSIERTFDPENIVNRIYPLGYGEGVNQLGIEKVNDGKPYLENTESIAKYGLKSYVWVDRSYEDAIALMSAGQSLLNQLSEPKVTYKVKAVDLYELTGIDIDKFDVGKIVRIVDPDFGTIDARIVSVNKSDLYGDRGNIELEIANKSDNASTATADLERRQEINEVYAQGATNIDSRDFADNCDPTHPVIIRFPIPRDVVNINEMVLTFETQKFRGYTRAIKGGGAIVKSTSAGGAVVKSTSSGGGTTATSSSGGGVAKSTAAGGGSTQTSSSGGGSTVSSEFSNPTFFIYSSTRLPIQDATFDNHFHAVEVNDQLNHRHSVSIPSHTHSVSIPSHTHEFDIPNHTHSVTIPNHTHEIDIPSHTHQIELPDHTHDIEFGIFELDETPTSVKIEVDGNVVPYTQTSGQDINLIPYLAKDENGLIERGRYAEIKITPNSLARINATVTSRLFIRSQIGGKY